MDGNSLLLEVTLDHFTFLPHLQQATNASLYCLLVVGHPLEQVFNALGKLRNIDPKFPIEVLRADIEEVGRENLATHVQDCIESADFCIADITGRTENEMFEIGYARGKGLKVIVICKDNEEIPSDLRNL